MSKRIIRLNSFSYKILLGVLLSASLPLAVLWLANSYSSEKIAQQAEADLKQKADVLGVSFNSWVDLNVRLLQQNATLPQIKSFDEQQQKPILKAILDAYEWSYAVFTIGADGYITARGDDKAVLNDDGTKKYFRGDREYLKEVIAGKDVGQQVLLSRRLGVPALVMCVPVAMDSNTFQSSQLSKGALCMAMKLTTISFIVENLRIGQTGFATLLDDDHKIIAHGNTIMVFEKLQDLSSHPVVVRASDEKQFIYSDEEGIKKIAYKKQVAQGWMLIIEQDFNDAYAQLLKEQKEFVYLLLGTIIISVLISFFIATSLTRPIQRIADATNAISKGQLDMKLEEAYRSDEIGELARAVERMAVSVTLALKKLKQRNK